MRAARLTPLGALAGAALTAAAYWPGLMTWDSVRQYGEALSGAITDWHPPVMAWLLGLGDAVVPGTGLFTAFDMLLAFGALLSLVALRPKRASWPAAAVTLAIVLSPQLLLYQGLVWKDVLFGLPRQTGPSIKKQV